MESPPAVGAWRAAGTHGVRIGILGPLRVDVDGVEQPITASRQRAVLTRLVLAAGEAVSADRLLEDVWGDNQPATGAKAVAYQISKLRSLLRPHDHVISTSAAGYALALDDDRVDATVFDRLVDRARAALGSDPETSETLIEEALALRRGRPLADVEQLFADVEVDRLDGRHLLAQLTLAEARLAQGRAAEMVDQLGTLHAEHPLDEAIAGVLMTALSRAGRNADALRVFDDVRRRLGSELGTEPSGQLRRLEQRLLTDEVTDAPAVSRAGSLPTPLSSFVGRDDEIDEIVTMLSSARLVTLTSFGGAGKTRLAIEVAARLRSGFPDGVWFVDLVPISDPVLLAETFAANVGVAMTTAPDADAHLRNELADKHALVVVDNCEHLADGVGALVGRLLRDAPDLRVLATSRVALGIPGEVVWNVPPLQPVTAGVELFLQRAGHVRPDAIADVDHAVVAQVCERLDGIPLAIELASARLRIMTLDDIAGNLEDRFELLVSTDRHADPRQKSLVAAMSWSHDLLEAATRDLLGQMATCVDGFSLDAAIAMSDGRRFDVVEHLERLVGAGLVTFSTQSGVGRYRMLETVRDFAIAEFEPADRSAACERHAIYFASVAADINAMEASGADGWRVLGDRELGNLRAAMAWTFSAGEPRLGMAMVSDLWRYFYEQTTGSNENVRWGRLALDTIDDDDDDLMLISAGMAIEAYNLNDMESVAFATDRIRRGLTEVRTPAVRSRALSALATAVQDTDPMAAAALYDEAWLASPPRRASIAILANQIEMSWMTGSVDRSMTTRLNQALATTSDRPPVALKVAAGIAAAGGRWDEVLEITAEPVTEKVVNDLHLLRVEALAAVGRVEEALELADGPHLDDYWADMQRIHLIKTAIALNDGDPVCALDCLRPVIRSMQADGRPLALAMHVGALLAVTAYQSGHVDDAAMLLGFVRAERERLHIDVRRAHRDLIDDAAIAVRDALGDARFDELAATGAASSRHALVDAAMNTIDR